MIGFWGIVSGIILFLLAFIAVMAARNGRLRIGIACLSLLVYFALGMGLYAQLGGPLPYRLAKYVGLEFDEDCIVLAYTFEEKKAIYVWLAVPSRPIPVYLALPWKEKQANQMHKMSLQAKEMKKAGQGTGRLIMRKGAEGDEDPWSMHPEPIPDYPAKDEAQ